jgi:cystathionine beta-lyase
VKVKYKDRRNTNSKKWDSCYEKYGEKDLLPFWIADMDFEAPEAVKDALKEFVDFGVFGYFDPPKSYIESFITWESTYHNYQVKDEWIRFSPGVVPAINWLIQSLTKENNSILIMTPVYYPFKEAIVNNNRNLVENYLVEKNGKYIIDFDDFENKIIANEVKLFIFCSPHNPIGRVWTKSEIKTVMDICKKHKVYVISDEIHQDIIMSGNSQTPTATVGDYDNILVTLTAATKTFNLAACKNSFAIIPDEFIREKFDNFKQTIRINEGNSFGYIAIESAYNYGRPWLNKVLEIIENNYIEFKGLITKKLPLAKVFDLEGTYLGWVDLSAYLDDKESAGEFLKNNCNLAFDYGEWFSSERKYSKYFRINFATDTSNVILAAERIVEILGKRGK